MSDTREVRSRVVIEIAGDAAKKIAEMTKEMEKAAAAQKNLTKETKETAAAQKEQAKGGKEFNLQESADQAAKGLQQRRAVEQELYRRGLVESTEAMRRKERDDKQRERELDKIRQEVAQRQQARQTLAMQGLALSGMGGIGGAYGQGLGIGSALEGAGVPAALARMAGPIGLAIGATTQYASTLKGMENYRGDAVYADPYLDPGTRVRGMFGALPFGETTISYLDTFSGRARGMERNQEAAERMRVRYSAENDAMRQRHEIQRQIDAGVAMRESMRIALPQVQTFDRSTATGERMQREANMLVEPLKQQTRAQQELSRAIKDRENLEKSGYELQKKRTDLLAEAKIHEETITKFESYRTRNMARGASTSAIGGAILSRITGGLITPGAGAVIAAQRGALTGEDFAVGINDARLKLENTRNDIEANKAQLFQNSQELKAAKEREASDRRQFELAQIAVQKAELANFQAQEQFGAGAAARYGGMGIGGRETGIAALEAIKSMGIENAPPELIAQAANVAPLLVNKMQEDAGVRIAQGPLGDRLRALGADEDVDFAANLADIRKEVNERTKANRDREQAADEKYGAGVERAASALDRLFVLITETLVNKVNNVELKLQEIKNSK